MTDVILYLQMRYQSKISFLIRIILKYAILFIFNVQNICFNEMSKYVIKNLLNFEDAGNKLKFLILMFYRIMINVATYINIMEFKSIPFTFLSLIIISVLLGIFRRQQLQFEINNLN